MSTQPHILMCPPDYYGVEYEINPWMNRRRAVDQRRAVRQWNDLRTLLVGAGAEISLLSPVKGLPDLVFTANAAIVCGRTAYLSRFRPKQRRGEQPYHREWFSAHGFEVRLPPESVFFEGAGDALFSGETLIAGYRIRSDALGHQEIGRMLGCRVIPLELVDPYYYHLDTCFCPLAAGAAAYYPGAMDRYGRQVLGELIEDLVEVDREEAEAFACNAVVVGRTVVTNTGCRRFHRELKSRGYEPVETPLSEFVKAGGAAKCLTLRLDGDLIV